MPNTQTLTIYHVRSALTHARVVIGLEDKQLARTECDRLNREAQTGVRAAYDDGRGGTVPAQALTHGGPIFHDGHPMAYEVETEKREVPA
jgi:hypothetical protein